MGNMVIVHDIVQPEETGILFPEEAFVFSAAPSVKHCIGCFGCWTKTPGICVIKDRHSSLAHQMAGCDHLVWISRCVYGGLSPDMKKVVDRCIGYIQPFFYIHKEQNEMHHIPRYPGKISFSMYFYGAEGEEEEQIARRLAKANMLNLNTEEPEVRFYSSPGEINLMSEVKAEGGSAQ